MQEKKGKGKKRLDIKQLHTQVVASLDPVVRRLWSTAGGNIVANVTPGSDGMAFCNQLETPSTRLP